MLDIQFLHQCPEHELTIKSSKNLSLWRLSRCAVVHWEYLEPLADILEVGDD
jgi:hypothetical protein